MFVDNVVDFGATFTFALVELYFLDFHRDKRMCVVKLNETVSR